MRRFRCVLFSLVASLVVLPAGAQSLQTQIARIAAQAHGRVGVACSLPGKTLACDFHASEALPMQSVYKLPIAVVVLHAVEQERLSLTQNLRFLPSDIGLPAEYSPLKDAHPHGGVEIPVQELLQRMIEQSDNVACDMLLRTLGGPAVVDRSLRSLGFAGIHIVDYEKFVDRDERLQYRNSATPHALVILLRRLADRSPLSPEHTQLLLGWMTDNHTGDSRIRAELPPGTVVADKTGTAGQNRPRMNATNDIALITLPDGRKLAIAVLIADARAPFPVRERVIAQIAQAIDTAATTPTPASGP
ncbi:MAG TPA: class A beta-lactamase [Acidobacteriaceae bacterium]|jgi:beta-lactamase class A|nr:class A beta-lactamase [Acidobacteriaceae bacterium]